MRDDDNDQQRTTIPRLQSDHQPLSQHEKIMPPLLQSCCTSSSSRVLWKWLWSLALVATVVISSSSIIITQPTKSQFLFYKTIKDISGNLTNVMYTHSILPTTSTSTFNTRKRRLVEQNDSDKIIDSHNHSDDDSMNILYIVTSGGKAYGGGDAIKLRFQQKVAPVVLQTVQSLLSHNVDLPPRQKVHQTTPASALLTKPWNVDVYLILGFELSEATKREFQDLLPFGVGLQVWQNAMPMAYECERWHDDENKDPVGYGYEGCYNTTTRGRKKVLFSQATVVERNTALARQHRYVIKDKLPYYDFFVVFEDDMVISRYHVEQHLKIQSQIQQLQLQQEVQKQNEKGKKIPKQSNLAVWEQPLQKQELQRFRAGFIRVEVLQDEVPRTQLQLDVPLTSNDEFVPLSSEACCSVTQPELISKGHTRHGISAKSSYTNIQNNETTTMTSNHPTGPDSATLMLWETNAISMGVRPLMQPILANDKDKEQSPSNSSSSAALQGWVAMLPGPYFSKRGFWPGKLVEPRPNRPRGYEGASIAQSAGWMATRGEILNLHQKFCNGGFLPPLDPPKFHQDGMWRNTVEFWSGGIQLVSALFCDTQRIVTLDSAEEFSKHLIYHSSNNKQFSIARKRLVLAENLFAQLQASKRFASASQITN